MLNNQIVVIFFCRKEVNRFHFCYTCLHVCHFYFTLLISFFWTKFWPSSISIEWLRNTLISLEVIVLIQSIKSVFLIYIKFIICMIFNPYSKLILQSFSSHKKTPCQDSNHSSKTYKDKLAEISKLPFLSEGGGGGGATYIFTVSYIFCSILTFYEKLTYHISFLLIF